MKQAQDYLFQKVKLKVCSLLWYIKEPNGLKTAKTEAMLNLSTELRIMSSRYVCQ